MALQITDAAFSRVQALVRDANATRPVVCISWERHQADNKRAPNGETVWTRVSEDHWEVFILDYANPQFQIQDFPTTKVRGLEFAFPVVDGLGCTIEKPMLDWEGEAFVIRT